MPRAIQPVIQRVIQMGQQRVSSRWEQELKETPKARCWVSQKVTVSQKGVRSVQTDQTGSRIVHDGHRSRHAATLPVFLIQRAGEHINFDAFPGFKVLLPRDRARNIAVRIRFNL